MPIKTINMNTKKKQSLKPIMELKGIDAFNALDKMSSGEVNKLPLDEYAHLIGEVFMLGLNEEAKKSEESSRTSLNTLFK